MIHVAGAPIKTHFESLAFMQAVWQGRHQWCHVAVMGGSGGGGVHTIHPHTPTHTHTHTHTHTNRGVVWSHSKAIPPSSGIKTPLKTNTSTMVRPLFEILLPVSSSSSEERTWDRMEDVEAEWREEITAARVPYRLSTGIPSQKGGSIRLCAIFRVSCVSWGSLSVSCGRAKNQTCGKPVTISQQAWFWSFADQ